jgi:hypothetical protein
MAVTHDDLFTSPDHYLHSFDRESAVFVPMDRAAYHRSIFLDARISPAASGSMRLPLARLAATGQTGRTAWIFHPAHCGSTLLARALDDPATNLVLREPLCLRDVSLDRDQGRLTLVKAMLAKRYHVDRPTVVKASVPVNFILPDLLSGGDDVRAIILHSGLCDYLLAVLRTPGHREWVARVTQLLSPFLGDLTALTDAERAAALWLGQMQAFAETMARCRATASLDCEFFFANPQPALLAAATCLEVPLTRDAAARTVAGPLFATHAKNPALSFDNTARLARRAELERKLAPELDLAEDWLARAGGAPVLPRPVV